MRLAFAVAAHLEPEILMVDEVLAVGDAEFQKKCLGKMKDVARSGRTVILVSHNMSIVQHLCETSILMRMGRHALVGPTGNVVAEYLSDTKTASDVSVADWQDRITNHEARLTRFQVSADGGLPPGHVRVGGTLHFSFEADFHIPHVNPVFGIIISTAVGEPILDLRSIHAGLQLGKVRGTWWSCAAVENLGLYPGQYLLSPWIMDAACRQDIDFVKLCSAIEVDPAPGPHGDLKLDRLWGQYWVPSRWSGETA